MRLRRHTCALMAAATVGLIGTGCGQIEDEVTVSSSALLGDRLPGTNAALFAEARTAFLDQLCRYT